MPVAKRLFVVEEHKNPSTDYFIAPYLRELGVSPVYCAFSQVPPPEQLQGAGVIFVRYVPANWSALVERCRDRIASVYFFMDDDLFDWRAFAAMPLRYQMKILRLSWSRRKWLASVGAQLLVSTPYLQQKYADWQPRLLAPRPPLETQAPPLTLFYHGSASHTADFHWLRPVVEKVLARNTRLVFEVIGNASVKRLFKQLPRVHVLHPMPWQSYRALLRRPGRAIGLAPLVDTPFNRARSQTKFFDITAAGAVGIYAQGPVYGGTVQHDKNGLLLPMDQAAWVEGILRLAEDGDLRERLLRGARETLRASACVSGAQ
ncbi:glycosyltransferase family 1 protein [Microbulbifer thermotolerans]|uniref:Glycosyltransferase family 1 protein n=1 Tax=Microbulbifer thermotolerans TaxID=252514 RepID=A0AB35I007_MICTH|nr:glycosyltransferase family 1 protein [Microbulbifer thermotolerans]MCX2803157.1 glycosyltransferase family 1 protein [Microbulbifer thermotolerans]